MENANTNNDTSEASIVAGEFTKSTMSIVFFDNIYYDGLNALTIAEVEDAFDEVTLTVSSESITEYKHSPYKAFFSLIYRFSEHFPVQSKTRECA